MKIKAKDLTAGMVTADYTIREDARDEDGLTVVAVTYRDGGQGHRAWDDPETEVEIR